MRLEGWYAEEGDIIAAGSLLARLSAASVPYKLTTRFRCLLATRAVSVGDSINPGDIIAELLAEGEDVPTGFRYCTLDAARPA
jgi:hypothetical protein